jgi:hypothetical protein
MGSHWARGTYITLPFTSLHSFPSNLTTDLHKHAPNAINPVKPFKMASTRSTHTYPAAPPVYSPAATAPKYTPNENMNNASCESKCQYECKLSPSPSHSFLCSLLRSIVSDSQILSYKDEKLELTPTVSEASVDSERSRVDSKRNYSEDSGE